MFGVSQKFRCGSFPSFGRTEAHGRRPGSTIDIEMGDESAWPPNLIIGIASVGAVVVVAALAALDAPSWAWLLLCAIGVVLISWAISHVPSIAPRLPWWFHVKSRTRERERREAARQAEIVADKERFASVIWTSGHYLGVLLNFMPVAVVTLVPPKGFDMARAFGQVGNAECLITFNGTTHRANAIKDVLGFSADLNRFSPTIPSPAPDGHYDVAWTTHFGSGTFAERDTFDIQQGKILKSD